MHKLYFKPIPDEILELASELLAEDGMPIGTIKMLRESNSRIWWETIYLAEAMHESGDFKRNREDVA